MYSRWRPRLYSSSSLSDSPQASLDVMDHNNIDIPCALHLFQSCCHEAERAANVAVALEQLREALPESFHGHLIALAGGIWDSSRRLRDLANNSQSHTERVPLVLDYLNIILPCLCRTLNDIMGYYEDISLTREMRWRKMYNKMTQEAGGVPLPQRFVLYNNFLVMLGYLLNRSPCFDPNILETLRGHLVELREKRGILPLPKQVGSVSLADVVTSWPTLTDPNAHWAEQIFSLPLASRTELKHIRPSKACGPFFRRDQLAIPPEPKVLFRRPFDSDRTSVVAYLNPIDQAPYLLIRSLQGEVAWFSSHGVHELCIGREGSALQLKRWSRSEQCSKLWAAFYFITWEEMVLFYCTFVALKARNRLTVQINPTEFQLQREKRLFQAQIVDDGYKHSLVVYEDQQTHGVRLHAAVWDGELKQCPVWTTFVTAQAQSSTWISRRSKHRVWLRNIQLYVFCKNYRQEVQRQNKSNAFEIYFVTEQGASKFLEVFTAMEVAGGSSDTPETTTVPLGK
ncbi:uncharacterized protein NCU09994 [Neurospora crassa OR74A]|uniref:Uncharacterized protein n=1 Tax=Neurospora crassa (strain ATCC 24698 / 74-OR23-1A / CBS 708.71 / DSM 1257 / FGSC 987) TaxID=367110 RepID=V5IPD0_NEUCR|nr:uncharacterized protein NCU09994 [Neurospora crassa OR74A]ESA43993.1 hypothetical protein, variant [Neurospora crassa OR74A]|eukprot:XP_011393293.1 uncharacterized protein NCU09994 [Neurospora crassa OR74A]